MYLSDRRNCHSLIMMYKIVNKLTPPYLTNLIPPTVGDGHDYNLRNRSNFTIPFCKTLLFQRSFIPRTLHLWNNLAAKLTKCTTLSSFKKTLHKSYCPSNYRSKLRQKLFNSGTRYWNCIHARLRLGCSKLNKHLFRNLHVIDSEKCICGNPCESVYHFFFECPLFIESRVELFSSLSHITALDLDLFLHGKHELSHDQNCYLFSQIQKYLKNTRRFD